jgi:hypothetical protein
MSNCSTYEERAQLAEGEVEILKHKLATMTAAKNKALEALKEMYEYYCGERACGDFTCTCGSGNCGLCEMRETKRNIIAGLEEVK